VTYKTLAGGFDMFCYTLALELLDKDTGIAAKHRGGGIFLKHKLMNIVRLGNEPYKYKLTFLYDGMQEITIKANNVILGMPRRSLELLTHKIPILQRNITTYGHVKPDKEMDKF
jgi:hypothetical protein